MKFQDKFYDVMDHKKLPSSEKEDEKCVSIKLYFHQILPSDISKREDLSTLGLFHKLLCDKISLLNTTQVKIFVVYKKEPASRSAHPAASI